MADPAFVPAGPQTFLYHKLRQLHDALAEGGIGQRLAQLKVGGQVQVVLQAAAHWWAALDCLTCCSSTCLMQVGLTAGCPSPRCLVFPP